MLLERRSQLVRGVRLVTRESAPFGVQIVPLRVLTTAEVRGAVERLPATEGPVVTSALNELEQAPFKECGFVEREILHLLRHDFSDAPISRGTAAIRSARRGDLNAVLHIDRSCFDEFWTFDKNGLTSARRATARSRYRVAVVGGETAGYAITGHAGATSYLQRLAVLESHRGTGVGSQLVSDAIRWAMDSGSAAMMVNTQLSNSGALAFYQAVGFELSRDQLKVLEWQG